MSKARDLADFQGSASALTTGTLPVDRVPYVGRRNLIINGDFQVWQRGTSATYTSLAKKYTTDRFASYWNETTVSKDSMVIDGCKYNAVRCNYTGSTYQSYLDTSLENPYKLSNKQVTFSMYVQGTAGRTFRMRMRNKIDGLFRDTVFSVDTVLTGDVQHLVVTGTCGDFSSLTPTASDYTLFEFYTTDAASADVKFTLVQLELGSVATPFEHRSYGEELALCQRFYQTHTAFIQQYGSSAQDTDNNIIPVVTMRATPSTSYTDLQTGNLGAHNVTTWSNSGSPFVVRLYARASSTGFFDWGVQVYLDAEL